jgi:predicted O-methyltransferase YrrM
MTGTHLEIDPAAPQSCLDPAEIDYICQFAARTGPGCFLEVGVYKGGFAYYLAKLARAQGRQLYLYDTFEGTPYEAPGVDTVAAGSFADTSVEAVRAAIPDAICLPGLFPDSAVPMPPIAFVHLDVDQYEGYKQILPYLEARMAPGGVIWLADYFVYRGANAATNEFMADSRSAFKVRLHAMLEYPK